MMIEQELAIELPISWYKTSLNNTFQLAAVSPRVNVLTLLPSWSGMMTATTIDSNQMRQN
jgi:hypothetical protein